MYDEYGEFEYGKYDIKFYKDDNYTDEQKKAMEDEIGEILRSTGKKSIEDLSALYMPVHSETIDLPLCRICKNYISTEENNWGEFDNCKAYGLAPDKYDNDCIYKDCPRLIPDKENPEYKILKDKIKLCNNEIDT